MKRKYYILGLLATRCLQELLNTCVEIAPSPRTVKAEELEAFKKRKYQYMAKDREGRDVFLADSGYVLQMAQMDFKHIKFHFTSEF